MRTGAVIDYILVIGAIAVGALAQRLSGMGLALVAGPTLVSLLHPVSAVIIVNLFGAAAAVVIGLRLRPSIMWARLPVLLPGALVGVVAGTLLTLSLPAATLRIVAGVTLIVALTASLSVRRRRDLDGPSVRLAAGFSSGLMNAAIGAGAPPMTIYAVLSGWEQRSFAATMQPYLLAVAAASVVSKSVLAPADWPALPGWMWLAMSAALLGGLMGGELLAPVTPMRVARRAVIIIAYASCAVAVTAGALAAGH